MLAARLRARLAMQEGEFGARTEVRRGHCVRRKLFQDDEQDRDRNELCARMKEYEEEEARQNLAEAERRWNFNFVKEEPLPGRWEWVKVGNEGSSWGCMNNEGKNFHEANRDEREKSETEANEKTTSADNSH